MLQGSAPNGQSSFCVHGLLARFADGAGTTCAVQRLGRLSPLDHLVFKDRVHPP